MHRTIPLLVLLAAPPAPAQSPDAVLDPETCAAYLPLDSAQRVVHLTTIEPIGDAINTADQATARQWADEVARACEGAPDRLLTDAAAEALAAD